MSSSSTVSVSIGEALWLVKIIEKEPFEDDATTQGTEPLVNTTQESTEVPVAQRKKRIKMIARKKPAPIQKRRKMKQSLTADGKKKSPTTMSKKEKNVQEVSFVYLYCHVVNMFSGAHLKLTT